VHEDDRSDEAIQSTGRRPDDMPQTVVELQSVEQCLVRWTELVELDRTC